MQKSKRPFSSLSSTEVRAPGTAIMATAWVTNPLCFCRDFAWVSVDDVEGVPLALPPGGVLAPLPGLTREETAILAAIMVALATFIFLALLILCCLCPLCLAGAATAAGGGKIAKTKSTAAAAAAATSSSHSHDGDMKLPRAWIESFRGVPSTELDSKLREMEASGWEGVKDVSWYGGGSEGYYGYGAGGRKGGKRARKGGATESRFGRGGGDALFSYSSPGYNRLNYFQDGVDGGYEGGYGNSAYAPSHEVTTNTSTMERSREFLATKTILAGSGSNTAASGKVGGADSTTSFNGKTSITSGVVSSVTSGQVRETDSVNTSGSGREITVLSKSDSDSGAYSLASGGSKSRQLVKNGRYLDKVEEEGQEAGTGGGKTEMFVLRKRVVKNTVGDETTTQTSTTARSISLDGLEALGEQESVFMTPSGEQAPPPEDLLSIEDVQRDLDLGLGKDQFHKLVAGYQRFVDDMKKKHSTQKQTSIQTSTK